jgi:hypothetical protein
MKRGHTVLSFTLPRPIMAVLEELAKIAGTDVGMVCKMMIACEILRHRFGKLEALERKAEAAEAVARARKATRKLDAS